ncbi:MAG TPA: FHA domain-containing protein [Micromonosporaceae bacterium]
MLQISYLPGEGTVIVAGNTVVLLDAPPDAEVSTTLWRLIAAEMSHAQVRAVLEAYRPALLPQLGVASLTPDGLDLLLRGTLRASVTIGTSTTDYVGSDRRVWTHFAIQSVSRVRLRLGAPESDVAALPLAGGVAQGSAVLTELISPPAWQPPPPPEPAVATEPPVAESPTTEPPTTEPPTTEPPVPTESPVARPVAAEPAGAAGPAAPPAPALPRAVEAPVAAPPAPMEGVFVEHTAPAPQPQARLTGAWLADLWVDSGKPTPSVPAASVRTMPPPPMPTPGPPPYPPTQAPAVPAAPPGTGGPAVWAVHCPRGHQSPPDAPFCRICGVQIVDRDLFAVERPPLGRLDFGTLGWVPLEGDLLIGSDPGAQPVGGPRPIQIAHPSIAGRHVEVQTRGWTVIIVDLESGPGTTLVLPGRAPKPLRANSPEPIVPDTVVWLGEQVHFTYLATPA